ncbi:MAG TPA: pyridoxamine 5'-phosphate oxidase [Bryobacteraceae bacterium]|jgi:pyridoxamine 5'-phosphate oxidase|nr:pyridoxamine 5'-phosphate oxidase [Bryobacteraceae bacterium]
MTDFAGCPAPPTGRLSLAELRRDYRLAAFDERTCLPDPVDQFVQWFQEAQRADLVEPNAMALATVSPAGQPSCRIVLLKEVNSSGFVFYTSYISRKGRELERNPACALTFLWIELERQVRIEGTAQLVTREKTEEYFRRRPRGSRLGALASAQSAVVADRRVLDERLHELERQYEASDEIPVPDYWGGYCVVPNRIEFWQGRPNRMHDRLLYTLGDPGWRIERLSP